MSIPTTTSFKRLSLSVPLNFVFKGKSSCCTAGREFEPTTILFVFLKICQPRPILVYFQSFQSIIAQFYNKIMWKNNPVSGAGIRAHNLLITSFVLKPLDQVCHPSSCLFVSILLSLYSFFPSICLCIGVSFFQLMFLFMISSIDLPAYHYLHHHSICICLCIILYIILYVLVCVSFCTSFYMYLYVYHSVHHTICIFISTSRYLYLSYLCIILYMLVYVSICVSFCTSSFYLYFCPDFQTNVVRRRP